MVPDTAAPLDVAAAAAVDKAESTVAADVEEEGPRMGLLLLDIFFSLPLLDGAIAGDAVTTVAATACVVFHLDGLSPAPDSDAASDFNSDPVPPSPLRIAAATPVTESVPTCLPETIIAVVTAPAVNVAGATVSAAEEEGSAEAYSAVTPAETGLVVVLGATASALDAGLASPFPLT